MHFSTNSIKRSNWHPSNCKGKNALKIAVTETTVMLTEKVNINTSTEETLIKVPGIGLKTAKNIFDYREQNGNFKTVKDLVNVKGIGDKSLKKMQPYLTI